MCHNHLCSLITFLWPWLTPQQWLSDRSQNLMTLHRVDLLGSWAVAVTQCYTHTLLHMHTTSVLWPSFNWRGPHNLPTYRQLRLHPQLHPREVGEGHTLSREGASVHPPTHVIHGSYLLFGWLLSTPGWLVFVSLTISQCFSLPLSDKVTSSLKVKTVVKSPLNREPL